MLYSHVIKEGNPRRDMPGLQAQNDRPQTLTVRFQRPEEDMSQSALPRNNQRFNSLMNGPSTSNSSSKRGQLSLYQ